MRSRDVLARLQAGDVEWGSVAPPRVAELIRTRGLRSRTGSVNPSREG